MKRIAWVLGLLAYAAFPAFAEDEVEDRSTTSPVFESHRDCQAFAFNNYAMCQTNECRGALMHVAVYCSTADCRAIAYRSVGMCQTSDCRAVILNLPGFCQSWNCRAAVGRNPGLCRW